MMQTKIAIPKMDANVAPRFETAETIVVCTVIDNEACESEALACSGCEGYSRIRLLQKHHVDTLICNGIKSFHRNLLQSLGIVVIDGVSMTVDLALNQFLTGQLNSVDNGDVDSGMEPEIPHEDLIQWIGDLLVSCGWQIKRPGPDGPFAVDLIASIKCPVCGQAVRLAVCCGAHIYRSEQEVREFHNATMNDFHARVYVHPTGPRLFECCRAFGIQHIDPHNDPAQLEKLTSGPLPPVTIAVDGHNRLGID